MNEVVASISARWKVFFSSSFREEEEEEETDEFVEFFAIEMSSRFVLAKRENARTDASSTKDEMNNRAARILRRLVLARLGSRREEDMFFIRYSCFVTIFFLKIRSQPRIFCVCVPVILLDSSHAIQYFLFDYKICILSLSLSLSLTRLREQSLLKLSRSSVFCSLVPTRDALFFTVVCEWFRTWRRPRRRARRTGSVSPPARSSRLISSISPTRRYRYSSRSRFDRHRLTHH